MRAAIVLLAVLSAVGSAGTAWGRLACNPASDPDRADIAATRAAIDAACDCAGAATRRDYLRCADAQIATTLANPGCRGQVRRCAKRSTCGRPSFVTCCRTGRDGRHRCKPMRSAAACEARGGTAGTCASCCDACPAPGDGPTCPAPTSTSATSTTTTTTTTTTITAPSEQCCFASVPCGGLDTCQEATSPTECRNMGGVPFGAGSCTPNPCFSPTTTTPPSACCYGDGQCVITPGFCECREFYGGTLRIFQICQPGLCTTSTTLP